MGQGLALSWYSFCMSIRKIPFTPDEYYHLYSRGNDKRKIFHSPSDHARFLNIIYLANSSKNFRIDRIKDVYSQERGQRLVSIGAYCLMPNHFHILIKQVAENGISKFMHKLLTAYSMYYNIKYKRTGTLFEGKFKSEHLNNDKYLKYIFSYIHLNPIKLIEPEWREIGIRNKKRILNFLETYPYSSYADFLKNIRKENVIVDIGDFPDYFSAKKHFQNEILDWTNFKEVAIT